METEKNYIKILYIENLKLELQTVQNVKEKLH